MKETPVIVIDMWNKWGEKKAKSQGLMAHLIYLSMSFAKFGLLPHHMTSGERPSGKRGQFWSLSTPLSASFHSKPIRLPGEDWKEAERGRTCKFLSFDSISTSGFYESDVLII